MDCHVGQSVSQSVGRGRCGRVSCSMLSGLFGPMGLLRGGPWSEASDEDEVVDWELRWSRREWK